MVTHSHGGVAECDRLKRYAVHPWIDDSILLACRSSLRLHTASETGLYPERHQALVALRKLLVNLFTTRELLVWVGDFYPEISPAIPHETVPLDDMSHAIVGLLERRGLIDERLFERLQQSRGLRREEIGAVWVLLKQAKGSDHGQRDAHWSVQTWARLSRGALRCSLILSAAWLLTRMYPAVDASRALRSAEKAVFSFLPLAYQSSGLPALIVTAVAVTAMTGLIARQANRIEARNKKDE